MAGRMRFQVVRDRVDGQMRWVLYAHDGDPPKWTVLGTFRWRVRAWLALALIWSTERVVR